MEFLGDRAVASLLSIFPEYEYKVYKYTLYSVCTHISMYIGTLSIALSTQYGHKLFGIKIAFTQKQCELNILFNYSLCWQWRALYWPHVSIVQPNSSGPRYRNRWIEADEKRMEPCRFNHHQDGCSHGSGSGAVPVARILAGSSLEVPLLYWTTRLTLR